VILRLVAVLGAAACLLSVLGVAAPSPAQAYVGESFVTAAGDLTSPAKSILTNPTFLAEEPVEAAAAQGATEGGSALLASEATGLLPDLALASPYVAGATVAAIGVVTACDALFGGCFGIFGSESDSSVPVSIVKDEVLGNPGGFLAGSWFPRGTVYFHTSGGSGAFKEGLEQSCGAHGYNLAAPPRPAGRLVQQTISPIGGVSCADGVIEPITVEEVVVVGDGSTRRLRWEGQLSEPSIANPLYCQQGASACTTTPPSNWSQKFAQCLGSSPSNCGLTRAQADRLGQAIAHRVEPAVVADPYQAEGVVPGCGGLTYEQCRVKLEAEGLEPVKNTLGWQQADPSIAPSTVVSLDPGAGTAVKTGTKVTVAVNPESSLMPVIVPQWEEHETYAHYAARLPAALVPHRQEVGETNEDAEAGPEAVLSTSPQPGSRADPSGQTDIDVRTNPVTAPAPGTGTGTCSAGVGAIDWSPLNRPLGSVFPFGVFGFFSGWLSSWETGSVQPPDWTVTIVPAGVFGSPDGIHVHIDLGFMAPVVSVVRVIFLFAAFVGMLWFLSTAAAKLQGDAS
jgi:hypothetical protein